MKWIKNILREVFGLFVDDGSFALAILIWLAVVRWIMPRFSIYPAAGIILFAGLALILIQSTIRYARRKQSAAKISSPAQRIE